MSDDRERLRVQWARGSTPVIAEIAEALVLPTDCIMAAGVHEGRVTAMFSYPEDEHDPPVVYGVALDRDVFGILHAVGEPYEIPGLLEDVKAHVEGRLSLGEYAKRRRRPKGKR